MSKRRTEGLTGRERECVELVTAGLSNKEIGRALGIATATVKIYMEVVCLKLGARNRTHAAALWWRQTEGGGL